MPFSIFGKGYRASKGTEHVRARVLDFSPFALRKKNLRKLLWYKIR